MTYRLYLVLALVATGVIAGCANGLPPQSTAYQRNIGPGSSASGVPTSDSGSIGRPGDPIVPGVSSGGAINR